LTITQEFYGLEPPQKPTNPYTGDPVEELLALRRETTKALATAFPEATVDSGGSKAVSISGGSLSRKIDVVPSNWWNSNKYAETGAKTFRGVQILDRDTNTRVRNTPFLHNALIELRDTQTGGGLRKAARLMKSVKYDEDVQISSYDVVAIAYNIDPAALTVHRDMELTILEVCLNFCRRLQQDQVSRAGLLVPDGHRLVFGSSGATVEGLQQLTSALGALLSDVLSENRRSFSKLAEARIDLGQLVRR
jgi:hypothetical protein